MRVLSFELLTKQVSLVEPLHDRSVRVTGLVMTSNKNKSPLSSDLPRGSLENLYEKIRSASSRYK